MSSPCVRCWAPGGAVLPKTQCNESVTELSESSAQTQTRQVHVSGRDFLSLLAVKLYPNARTVQSKRRRSQPGSPEAGANPQNLPVSPGRMISRRIYNCSVSIRTFSVLNVAAWEKNLPGSEGSRKHFHYFLHRAASELKLPALYEGLSSF